MPLAGEVVEAEAVDPFGTPPAIESASPTMDSASGYRPGQHFGPGNEPESKRSPVLMIVLGVVGLVAFCGCVGLFLPAAIQMAESVGERKIREALETLGPETLPYVATRIHSPDFSTQYGARELMKSLNAPDSMWIEQSVSDC